MAGKEADKGIQFSVSPEQLKKVIYSNHVQVSASLHDIGIDFFEMYSGETDADDDEKPLGTHVQRVVIPASLLKGFTNVLANVVVQWEAQTGLLLPLSRGKRPDDMIEVFTEGTPSLPESAD